MKPNIFDYAPKELSQDAFIVWLILYFNCDVDISQEDKNQLTADDYLLKKCSEEFITILLAKQINKPIKIKKIDAGKQRESIDIWATIELESGEQYLIIIEDKTSSSYHDNQLSRYREIGKRWCKENNYYEDPICIYLKTGNESRQSLRYVTENGYSILGRTEIVEFLKRHEKIKNNIFTDFILRLTRIEASHYEFNLKVIGDWKDNDWQGFFLELDKRELLEGWGFVNNVAGGFWNAVIHWPFWKGFPVHFQIEQGRICFKICFDEGETENVNFDPNVAQDEWLQILLNNTSESFPFKRAYPLVHRGKTRTVGYIEQEIWMGANDSLLDIEMVLKNIGSYKNHISKIVQS